MRFKFTIGLMWTQWYIGVWWHPVRKDLSLGVNLGPLYMHWERKH